MEKTEAYKLVAQVCAQYRGTLAEHAKITGALRLLKPDEDNPVESEQLNQPLFKESDAVNKAKN